MTIAVLASAVAAFLLLLFLWNYRNLVRASQLFYNEKREREAILNSLYDGVIEYNSDFHIILMNPKAESILGIQFSELKDIPITPEIAKEKPALRGLVEIMYPALASYASPAKEIPGTSARTMEVHLSSSDLKLLVTLTNVVDETGNIKGFLKILHDISREQLVSRIKSEFVSIAAHQLRTPLSAIKWTVRLLLDGDAGPLNAEQHSFLTKGYEINERMITLVNDLLNAARIEEGRFGYDFKEVDLGELLEIVYNNSSSFAKSRSINLEFEDKAGGIPHIYADPEKLNLVINNLLDNAIKYTPPGGRVILKISRDGDFAVVSIADTGIGIPEEEKKRMFSKFFRASNALRTETQGTGLGLFIVRNIVRRHGGEITFVSEIGRGTIFTVALPLKKELVPEEEAPALEEFLESI